jgi:tetratricopeptide (TPR) repeat protein
MAPAVPRDPRERERQFWALQRAGMDALKRDGDVDRAAELLQQALALDASHEDTRYYLGNALAARGDAEAALAQFEELRRHSPQSHRAHARWGTLRADTAASEAHLTAAEGALSRAHALNPEETGVLLALAEINLLQGELARADARLAAVARSNPRSAHAIFLGGYLRWTSGDSDGAATRLRQCRAVLGPDWKPAGATAEGDVVRRAHAEHTPLARFLGEWDGRVEPRAAYASLDRHLREYRRRLSPRVAP